jgi:hypothetical protein
MFGGLRKSARWRRAFPGALHRGQEMSKLAV